MPLDLRVTITGGDYTDIAQVWIDRGKGASGVGDPDELNGRKPGSKFGNINLQTVKNKPKSGEGQFRFCWVRSGTDESVEVEHFVFTTYDTDERGTDTGIGIKEKLLMDVSQAGYYQLTDDTELITTCEDGSAPPCAPGSRTVFTSTTRGPGSDNPTDPNNLTPVQKARSIAFTFRDTSCWDFTYDHYCPADQPGWAGSEPDCAYYTGGNFLFAGDSDEMIRDGECITRAPVPTPPFEAPVDPTEAPVEPTEAPVEPTGSPTFSPPECPEDVFLIDTDGVTEIPIDGAVRIIDQDTSTVTVRLFNAWTSEQEAIDSIFYRYRIDTFDDRCYENQDVGGGDSYADITIRCAQMEPYARLDICVADNDGALRDGDDAEVPRCCEPDLEPDTPVVCYKLVIWCETRCPETVARRGRSLRGGGAATAVAAAQL